MLEELDAFIEALDAEVLFSACDQFGVSSDGWPAKDEARGNDGCGHLRNDMATIMMEEDMRGANKPLVIIWWKCFSPLDQR